MGGALAAGGAGFSVLGSLFSIFGQKKKKEAIREATERTIEFDRFKLNEFRRDSQDAERELLEGQRASFAGNGVDFRHGSPMAVATNTAMEFAEGVERVRLSAFFREREIRAQAEAGISSATGQQVATAIGGVSSVLQILGGR